MPTLIANRRFLAALLCSLLLVLRVGEAHLHKCFDGNESAASLHFIDVGVEHSVEAGVEHQDSNIKITTAELSKPPLFDFDIPPVLLLALLFLLAATTGPVALIRKASVGWVRAASWLRPPLRGPPLTALS